MAASESESAGSDDEDEDGSDEEDEDQDFQDGSSESEYMPPLVRDGSTATSRSMAQGKSQQSKVQTQSKTSRANDDIDKHSDGSEMPGLVEDSPDNDTGKVPPKPSASSSQAPSKAPVKALSEPSKPSTASKTPFALKFPPVAKASAKPVISVKSASLNNVSSLPNKPPSKQVIFGEDSDSGMPPLVQESSDESDDSDPPPKLVSNQPKTAPQRSATPIPPKITVPVAKPSAAPKPTVPKAKAAPVGYLDDEVPPLIDDSSEDSDSDPPAPPALSKAKPPAASTSRLVPLPITKPVSKPIPPRLTTPVPPRPSVVKAPPAAPVIDEDMPPLIEDSSSDSDSDRPQQHIKSTAKPPVKPVPPPKPPAPKSSVTPQLAKPRPHAGSKAPVSVNELSPLVPDSSDSDSDSDRPKVTQTTTQKKKKKKTKVTHAAPVAPLPSTSAPIPASTSSPIPAQAVIPVVPEIVSTSIPGSCPLPPRVPTPPSGPIVSPAEAARNALRSPPVRPPSPEPEPVPALSEGESSSDEEDSLDETPLRDDDAERLVLLSSVFPMFTRRQLKDALDVQPEPVDMEALVEELLSEVFINESVQPFDIPLPSAPVHAGSKKQSRKEKAAAQTSGHLQRPETMRESDENDRIRVESAASYLFAPRQNSRWSLTTDSRSPPCYGTSLHHAKSLTSISSTTCSWSTRREVALEPRYSFAALKTILIVHWNSTPTLTILDARTSSFFQMRTRKSSRRLPGRSSSKTISTPGVVINAGELSKEVLALSERRTFPLSRSIPTKISLIWRRLARTERHKQLDGWLKRPELKARCSPGCRMSVLDWSSSKVRCAAADVDRKSVLQEGIGEKGPRRRGNSY